jgi:hypothetical protein
MIHRDCKRCGQSKPETKSKHVKAHRCPHGRACVLSAAARRRGQRVTRCLACWRGRQLELPFPIAEAAE